MIIKQRHLHRFILTTAGVFVACLIAGPGVSLAAISYTRTVVGSTYTFNVSFDDFQNDVGMTPDYLVAWGINIYDADDETIYQTDSVPISVQSHTFTITLPPRNIMAIGFYGCSRSDDCTSQGTILEGAVVYEETPGSIFVAPGTGRLPSKNSSYAPLVTISSPSKGSIFSHIGTIKYEAIDWNDKDSRFPKDNAGMGPTPVSLFYSDKLGDSAYFNSVIDPKLKLDIAKGLPAVGSYDWTTPNLTPGNFYRVITDAIDMEGLTGEMVSDPFTVDYTSPVFTISTDPAAVRHGTVDISVESSKDLPDLPYVTVRQNGQASSTILTLTAPVGVKNHFTGTYTVVDGYDGTARISVTGTDAAGNVSTTTVSGGTFSVGINPPSVPVIVSPTNKTAVTEDQIDIKGTARDDTTVLLKVNGKEKGESKPDSNGNFIFAKVALDPNDNHGTNYISVSSRDAFGVVGPSADVEVKRNIPPTIALIKPAQDDVVSDQENISVKGEDGNGDSLFYTYQIQPGRTPTESAWTSIGDAVPSSGYIWNATEVDDGEYSLRVIADDGYARATSTPVRFTVKNTVPFFRFEDGRKTVTKDSDPTIVGRALSSNNVGIRPPINNAEYSMDRGATWGDIDLSQIPPFYERKFTLKLKGLKEGTYPILFRAKDSRGTVGNAIHLVTVDTNPPAPPRISYPRDGAVLSSANDEDTVAAGLQTTISGTAEPGSVVTLSDGSATTSVKTLANGNFRFPGLTLAGRSVHLFRFFTTDEAGNVSKPAQLSLTYDNPPVITLISPKPFHGLTGQAHVIWSIRDADGDPIGDTTVSYRLYGGEYRTIAAHAPASGDIPFDTTALPEANDYELRITTTDGIMPVSLTASFSVDRVKPAVESLTLVKSPMAGNSISGSGIATDNASGIEFVEYSVRPENSSDSDDIWYKALVTRGFGGTRASYAIRHSLPIDDGTYTISARAIDEAGNISGMISRQIRIDNTAPRIGSFFVRANGVDLAPDDKGSLSIPGDKPIEFGISLEGDTESASLLVDGRPFELTRDIATGLWMGSIPGSSSTSTRALSISAKDESGNEVKAKMIGSFISLLHATLYAEPTKPINGAHIRVLKWKEGNQRFEPFMTNEGKELSVDTDPSGKYELALPQGKYRIVVTAKGYATLDKALAIERSGFVEMPLVTKPMSGIGLWAQDVRDWLRY